MNNVKRLHDSNKNTKNTTRQKLPTADEGKQTLFLVLILYENLIVPCLQSSF